MTVRQACKAVIVTNPEPVAHYMSGRKVAIKYLAGQVQRITKGTANPGDALKELKRLLK